MAGVQTTPGGNTQVYGGLLYEIRVWRGLYLVPSFAFAYREVGDGRDIGKTCLFRSGIEAAYRLRDGKRIGAMVTHGSNAAIGDSNPGEESVFLTFSVPLGGPCR